MLGSEKANPTMGRSAPGPLGGIFISVNQTPGAWNLLRMSTCYVLGIKCNVILYQSTDLKIFSWKTYSWERPKNVVFLLVQFSGQISVHWYNLGISH